MRRSLVRRAGWLDAVRRLSEHLVETFNWRYQVQGVVVERVTLALAGLPPAFDGYTIAQVSDLHFGPLVAPESVHTALDLVPGLQPDLIVVTGDFVSRLTHGEAHQVTRALQRLRAPDGVFAVLGNHDWWEAGEAVEAAVRAGGATVLSNAHQALWRGAEALYLAGLDDARAQQADLPQTLAGIPAGALVVVLAHEPYVADWVAADGRAAVQLSGHSHGGQIRLPRVEGAVLRLIGHHRYPRGLAQVAGLQVYTNRGLGVVGLPMRWNCPPEITLLTLRRS